MNKSLNSVVLALMGLLASSLADRAPLKAENEDLQKQLDAVKAERDAALAKIHFDLEEIGDPLTDEQKAQLQQLLDATSAATPHDDVPPPVIDSAEPVQPSDDSLAGGQ